MAALLALCALSACTLGTKTAKHPVLEQGTQHGAEAGQAQEPNSDAQEEPANNVLPKVGAWEHRKFPNKEPVHYYMEGANVCADSHKQMSVLEQSTDLKPEEFQHIAFSWKSEFDLNNLHAGVAARDDAPARVVLVFDGDRSKMSMGDHFLSELSLLLTGQALPYATLAYTWTNGPAPSGELAAAESSSATAAQAAAQAQPEHSEGTVLHNARTSRIRSLILDSGKKPQWRSHKRDIHADFRHAFGEAPGPIRAVLLISDTDNTGGRARTCFGGVALFGPDGGQPGKATRPLRQLQ